MINFMKKVEITESFNDLQLKMKRIIEAYKKKLEAELSNIKDSLKKQVLTKGSRLEL